MTHGWKSDGMTAVAVASRCAAGRTELSGPTLTSPRKGRRLDGVAVLRPKRG